MDVEKASPIAPSPAAAIAPSEQEVIPRAATRWSKARELNQKFERFTGLESRGIGRVPTSEREQLTSSSYLQIMLLWISADMTANPVTLAMLGPLVFDLSFTDAALCAVGGTLIGCLGPAYTSTWGPRSGNRTMIVNRYLMGYYTSKICAALNVIIMLGYGTVNCVIAGQILSAVQGGGMSVIVGIVIVAAITLVVSVFGMKLFHTYERYAWLSQLLLFFVLIGSAGPRFNTSTASTGSPFTVAGHRISFLSLCMSSPLAWAPSAADYFVYYPSTAPIYKIFLSTYSSNVLAFCLCYLLGVGLASGVAGNPAWADAYNQSQGALILVGYQGLGHFGSFCGVIIALGVTADNIAATYSAGITLQILSRKVAKVPRWVLTCGILAVYTACAIGGRESLFAIIQNFIALMGYWVIIFVVIVLLEQFLFRSPRTKRAVARSSDATGHDDGFDWDAWDVSELMPFGLASLFAFLVGWAGAIIGMDQAWYTGPVARAAGGDIGLWMGAGFAMITYPVLRILELKHFGR